MLLLLVASGLWWAAPPVHAEARAAEAGRVAFIGVPGLLWSDVNAQDTPRLWRLAGESGLGSVSVKTVGTLACPYDGWLTVSSGVRSAVGQRCGLPPEPVAQGAGAVVTDVSWLHTTRDGTYAGTLGEAVHAAGQCTAAVGRGAALGLADRAGKVDLYASEPGGLTDWSRCRVLAVDVDTLVRPYLVDGKLPQEPEPLAPERRRALAREADARIGTVLDRLPAGTEIVLAGISDHGSVPHLRVAMWKRAATPSGEAAGEVSGPAVGTNSTRRDDLVVLPDITPTVLAAAGIAAPPTVVGQQWRLGPTTTPADLRRDDLAGVSVRGATGVFFTSFAVVQVSFYVLAYFLLSRRRRLRLIGSAAIVLAAMPVSTYAVNLLPWDRSPYLIPTAVAGVLAITALIATIALCGPWRRDPLGPPAAVAVITAAILVGDLLTGTTLQFNSLMGYTAVVGGRYYGLANIPFALLATSVLTGTAIVAEHLVRAGRQKAAVAVVVGLGVIAMLLAGWPGVGSDFGGVIAFVPGIAVVALLVAGRRVSLLKLAGFCVLGGVLVSAIAVLDFLRPPATQTHLGRFVGQVIDGTFLPMIGRKLGAMLNTMLSPNLMPIVLAGMIFLVFAVLRPGKVSAGAVPRAFTQAPMLRAGLIGALVSGVIGMLVNDSGTAVLSMVVALSVPLVLHAGVRAMASGDAPEQAERSGTPEPSGSGGSPESPGSPGSPPPGDLQPSKI
ncbi:hypothetical protein [Nonomuraea jiangxiensis]|uniref:hypothetical protein n=1 Tax=Nonomuraea jiangxiensis TaxID=633440 RepID=UPI000B89369D|nr:hypothetical protein [Nonomuraea jiangxiensis]